MKYILSSVLLLPLLCITSNSLQVAVIGTTGNIGRAAIQQLSDANISTKCLLRHDLDSTSPSATLAASLAKLPNVQMVKGDISKPETLPALIEGCDAILCLQGPPKPNPIKSMLPFLSNENDTSHSRVVNYVGMQNVINAVKQYNPNMRIVRLTGKGEEPFSIFSILINMLGNLAKAWNYEGEQLLRTSGVKYFIIRPGLLKSSDDYTIPPKAKMIRDNGGNMKVTPVTYDQIADICIQSLDYENCNQSTLTVMNVKEGEGVDDYGILLEKVENDKEGRFPDSLLEQHKMGARIGFVASAAFLFGVLNVVKSVIGFLLGFI